MADEAVSLRQFAAMNGWNPGHAHRLKVAGRLVMVDVGGRELVHVARSLARIAESSDPQKGYMRDVNQRQRELHRGAAPPPPPPTIMPPATDDGTALPPQSRNATFNQARTAREVFEAKLAQLRYEQEAGKLISAEAVRGEFARQIVGVRDHLLQIPDRLVTLDDATREALTAEIRAALAHFAGGH